MNIIVPVKQVPNLTDELEINSEGDDLDHGALQYVLNEFDEHAIEEAVLAKEAAGGAVTVIGVQAADDRDGQIGPMIAAHLGLPYVGVVTGVEVKEGKAVVHKEYAGGVMAEFEVTLPTVVGVQAAHQPPRYAPVSKIRQIAKTMQIEEIAGNVPSGAGSTVRRMFKPESAGHAEMWDGSPEEIAEKIVALIAEKGLLKREA